MYASSWSLRIPASSVLHQKVTSDGRAQINDQSDQEMSLADRVASQGPLDLDILDPYNETDEFIRLHGSYQSLTIPQLSCCGKDALHEDRALLTFANVNTGSHPPSVETARRFRSVFHANEKCIRSTFEQLQLSGKKEATLTIVGWEPTVDAVLQPCWTCHEAHFPIDLTDWRRRRNVVIFSNARPPQEFDETGESMYKGSLMEKYVKPLTSTQIDSGIVGIPPHRIPRQLDPRSPVAVDSESCAAIFTLYGPHREWRDDWEESTQRREEREDEEDKSAGRPQRSRTQRRLRKNHVNVKFSESSRNAPQFHLDLSVDLEPQIAAVKSWVEQRPPIDGRGHEIYVHG